MKMTAPAGLAARPDSTVTLKLTALQKDLS